MKKKLDILKQQNITPSDSSIYKTSFNNMTELLNFNDNCVSKHVRGDIGRTHSRRL